MDLVLSNTSISVTRSTCPIVNEDTHHPSLEICVPIASSSERQQSSLSKAVKYDFRKADFMKLYECLSKTTFNSVYNEVTVDSACQKFYDYFYSAMDNSIPKNRITFNPKFPRYFTKKIIDDIKIKQKLYKKIKKPTCNEKLKIKYKLLRKSIKNQINIAYDNYVRECERILSLNSKSIWQYTTDKLDKKHTIPSSFVSDNEIFSTPQTIAEKFAEHFEQCFDKENALSDIITNNILRSSTNNFTDLISKEEVSAAISKLKPKGSAGPDLIPAYIIKGCSEYLIKPLCYLFNLSIKCSVYPTAWKTSRVCPVYKKGEKNNFKNYRPITILNSFSKCFEIILCDRLLYHTKQFLSPHQHGFTRCRSTVSNLAVFTSEVSSNITNNKQVDTVFFDFSMAFDLMNHSILLLKLFQQFDIPSYLIHLINSYLCDRSQYVTYGGVKSKCFSVSSGVPQGSILGPLLFNLFINDLPKYVKYSSILLYADDLKIYRVINDNDDNELLQSDIDSISEWSLVNIMKLNTNKCSVMHFSRCSPKLHSYVLNGSTLTKSNLTKDLGVYLDNKLSFKQHIEMTINSAQKILGFLIRLSKNLKKIKTIETIYHALVRSKLEYACCIWNPVSVTSSNEIEKVQKRLLRYLHFRNSGTYPHYIHHPVSTSELLSEFNMMALKNRRSLQEYVFIFKLLNNKIDCAKLLHSVNFRAKSKMTRLQSMFLIQGSLSSPLNRMLNNFNCISQTADPFHLSFNKFKKQITSLILEQN